jgi:hypothetical protein
MATLNIQSDYGAAGDGSTDDTEAILNAIQDAQSGDTVYLPSGTYLVNRDKSPSNIGVVLFRSQFGVDDIEFVGDGESTEILLDGGHDTWTQVVRIAPHSTITGLTLRDFVINGNRSNQKTKTGGHGLAVPAEGATDNNDITIRNVRIQDNIGSGLSVRSGGVTIEDVTVLRPAEHGISPNHPNSANDVIIRRCLVKESAQVGSGDYAFDFSDGNGLIEDSVAVDPGSNGTKVTGDADSVTWRRLRVDNANGLGFQKTGTGSVTLTMEDVVITNSKYVGIRPDADTTLRIPSGTDVVSSFASDGHGILAADNAEIQADGTLHTQDNAKTPLYAESNTSGYISELQASGNADSITNRGSIDIQSQGNNPIMDIDGVPTASEVGAFTGSDITDTEETYRTDFRSATVGEQPEGWSREWATAAGEFNIADQGTLGGSSLSLSADTAAPRGLRWTAPGEAADVELHALVTVPEFDADTNGYARLYARGSGTSGNESAYFSTVRNGAFAVRGYDNGDMNQFWSGGSPAAGQRYLVRFRVEGTDLRLKFWEYGTTEPGDWDATVTDSSLSSTGWAGIGADSSAMQYWDAVTVGTGGLDAPLIRSLGVIQSEGGLIQSSGGLIDTV